MTVHRRQFLSTSLALIGGFLGSGRRTAAAPAAFPPVRTITRGPQHHWFGYYDKLEFDPTSRYCLGMQVDFEHRSPAPEDVIRVGMVDLRDGDRWIELGTSSAWCWQQGCMLQWAPGSRDTVLWNDREEDRYVCRILNVASGKLRTIPHPIYALSPDGRTAIATDFRRLGVCRPGYGYNGIPDPIAVVGPDRMTQDAHCSYLPGNEWILNDTYPDADRLQKPYLYHVADDRVVPLGAFRSPAEYTGEWRCDTHPRFSPDGRSVVIDSPHTGDGRQLHLIDISGIVG